MSDIGKATKDFEENVERADIWVNGGAESDYKAKDGSVVPSIMKLNNGIKIVNIEAKMWSELSREYANKSQEYASGAFLNSGIYENLQTGLANTNYGDIFIAMTNGVLNLYKKTNDEKGYEDLLFDVTSINALSKLDLRSLSVKETRLENFDLNNLDVTGIFRYLNDDSATPDNNFPDIQNASGIIEVINTENGIILQRLTTWRSRCFWRLKYSTFDFQDWQEIASTKLTDLMSKFEPSLPQLDLNLITSRGVYRTGYDDTATVDNGYPDIQNASGFLEVLESSNLIKQTLTTWHNRTFIRTRYLTFNWQEWVEVGNNSSSEKPYFNKKIVWIGDSIVAGNTYPEQVGSIIGAREVVRAGFSSHTMAAYPSSPLGRDKVAMYRFADAINTGDWSTVINGGEWLRDNADDDKMTAINKLVNTDWNTVDYLVIAFGTNDIYDPTPLGDDFTPTEDGSTFKGSMSYSIEKIQERYPHIQILFITPTFRTRLFVGMNDFDKDVNSDTLPDPDGIPYIEYINAMKESEDIYHVPVFDFYRKSGINVRTFYEYLPDGVHPGDDGVSLFVKKISAFMLNQ